MMARGGIKIRVWCLSYYEGGEAQTAWFESLEDAKAWEDDWSDKVDEARSDSDYSDGIHEYMVPISKEGICRFFNACGLIP